MPDSSLAALLRRSPYFSKLAEPQLAALAHQLLCRTFAAGENVIAQGGPSAGMWIIQQGRVKIFQLSPDGHEHILRLLGPGDTFNDVTVLDNGPNPAGAGALSAATLWLLPCEAFATALRADHGLALAALATLAGTMRTLVRQIEELSLYSAMARLARFLLVQSENPSLSGPGITRTAMATHLATTPETVSRSLRTLEDVGAIRFERHQIKIVNAELLREIAML